MDFAGVFARIEVLLVVVLNSGLLKSALLSISIWYCKAPSTKLHCSMGEFCEFDVSRGLMSNGGGGEVLSMVMD